MKRTAAALITFLALTGCGGSETTDGPSVTQADTSSVSDDERGFRAGYSGCAGIFPRTQNAFDERGRELGKQAALDGEPIEYAEGMSRGCTIRYLEEG